MQMAQHLGVSQAFKPEAVSPVQPRGVSMIMSSEGGPVPYGPMMPQLATLQINSPVRISNRFGTSANGKFMENLFLPHTVY